MKLSDSMTKNDLERHYVNEGMSLEDIATRCKCSRQYILKLLRRYRIHRRNKSAARILATSGGKITVARMDASGNRVMVPHVRRIVDEDFFKQRTPKMAWVLGVIYTDGCLVRPHGSVKGRLTLSQKEPELIEKVLALLNSNAKLLFTPKRGITGAVHRVSISNAEVYQDLEKLGVTPRKSLSLTFPEVPAPLVRHFIRGCWDGDGSVYWDGGDARKPCASFVSGSKEFIEQIETVAKQAMHGSWLLKVFVLGLMICGKGPGGIAAVSRSRTGHGSSQYLHAGHHRGLTRRTRRLQLTTKAVITA